MGGVVKSVTKVLGLGGSGQEEALKRQAEQQRMQYEAQLKAQTEAAKLASANTIDNVTNVQTGDALQAIDSLTSSKKKKQGAGISSALGVV